MFCRVAPWCGLPPARWWDGGMVCCGVAERSRAALTSAPRLSVWCFWWAGAEVQLGSARLTWVKDKRCMNTKKQAAKCGYKYIDWLNHTYLLPCTA